MLWQVHQLLYEKDGEFRTTAKVMDLKVRAQWRMGTRCFILVLHVCGPLCAHSLVGSSTAPPPTQFCTHRGTPARWPQSRSGRTASVL